MYSILEKELINIQNFDTISLERKTILQHLIDFIQEKIDHENIINLNFICTHNSRRSHLAQIWAQFSSFYYKIPNVFCYSGGTEETAVYPKIIETLVLQGFQIVKISEGKNPIYTIKHGINHPPIIAFSKKFDDNFNPSSHFAAVMTCSDADYGCPNVNDAEIRIPITYEDPKTSDNKPNQNEVYIQKSNEIATEMMYVFSQIKRK